jgi:SAM-dependent methyltransferase
LSRIDLAEPGRRLRGYIPAVWDTQDPTSIDTFVCGLGFAEQRQGDGRLPSLPVVSLTPDYDSDPGRSRSFRLGWQEDVHGPVVERLILEGVSRVLDVGSGIGRFASAVGGRIQWLDVDESPRQLADCPHRPVIRANAVQLPLADQSVDAVVLLWMLYHLDDPRLALSEAWRVVRPGGLVAACASNRGNDPELVPQGYPRTTFDGEAAAEIVADVFGPSRVEVERWDAPMVQLHDRDEVAAYARSDLIPLQMAEAVGRPFTLTKRGCLVWVRRPLATD